MHELGVVFHCIDQVNKIAAENNVKKINSVTVEIGEVSTVIPALFEDCWSWAVKKETVLKDAKINSNGFHFGLNNMAQRASELGADFSIISEFGDGTKIRLEVPVE